MYSININCLRCGRYIFQGCRIAGMELRKGRIAPGADADLLALDDKGFVKRTWVRGQLAYQENLTGTGESVLT